MKLIILQGAPGAGKTTWAKKWVAAAPAGMRWRVSRDDIRRDMAGLPMTLEHAMLDRAGELVVSRIERNTVKAILSVGGDVVVDATNLNAGTIAAWKAIAQETRAEIVFERLVVGLPTLLERVRERAAAGGRDVPAEVICRMYERMHRIASTNGGEI